MKDKSEFDGILFLDIDGVLNTRSYMTKIYPLKNVEKDAIKWSQLDVDPKAVNVLNRILNDLNLAIVLSSSWRKIDWHREALFGVGIDNYSKRLLGYTGSISSGERGTEIEMWIKENNYRKPFIIIDDEVSDMGKMLPNCLKINSEIGLTIEHVAKAIQLFEFVKLEQGN